MDDFDLDSELANLLNTERRKQAYYLESLESEQQQVVEAFFDHVISLQVAEMEDITPEVLTNSSAVEMDDEAADELYATIHELVNVDINKHESLVSGEVYLTGDGIYMHQSDEDGHADVDVLEKGGAIRGSVDRYAVLPIIDREAIIRSEQGDDEIENLDNVTPDLWVVLNDVEVTDATGNISATIDIALVSLTYPGIRMKKVLYGNETLALPQQSEKTDDADLTQTLASQEFIEACTEAENDLNHNYYDRDEHYGVRAAHYDILEGKVGGFDWDTRLAITASDVQFAAGGSINLFEQVAIYDGPTIIKFSDTWRVVHGFSLEDSDSHITLAYIFPEKIHRVRKSEL